MSSSLSSFSSFFSSTGGASAAGALLEEPVAAAAPPMKAPPPPLPPTITYIIQEENTPVNCHSSDIDQTGVTFLDKQGHFLFEFQSTPQYHQWMKQVAFTMGFQLQVRLPTNSDPDSLN